MPNTIDESKINHSENKAAPAGTKNYYQASEFASITQATTLILKKINFPVNRRRNFICALQGVANGRAQFPASHYVLAKHIGHKGKQETGEMSVYREIQALIQFQASSNILLFDIEQGGGRERKPTVYHDFITPCALRLADCARQMKRDNRELKFTPIGKVMESMVEEIIKDLRPFSGSLISNRPAGKEKCSGGGSGGGSGRSKNHKAKFARQKNQRQLLGELIDACFEEFDPVREPDQIRRFARQTADFMISTAEAIIAARNGKTTDLFAKVISPKLDHPFNVGDEKKVDGLPDSSPLGSLPNAFVQTEEPERILTSSGLENTNPLLNAALGYARRGWRVLPLHTPGANGICSCSKSESCPSSGKHPRTKNGVKEATTDEIQIQKWWSQFKDANIGIAAGPDSGILCLDIDPRNGGDQTLEEIIKTYGALPATFEVATGGGGQHLFFQFPAEAAIRNSTEKLGRGLDVKAGNGFVVAAPSIHRSGQQYSIKSGQDPVSLPDWLLDLLTAEKRESRWQPGVTAAAAAATAAAAQNNAIGKQFVPGANNLILDGVRNEKIFKIACAMVGRGEGYKAVATEIERINFLKCSPMLDETEIQQIINNALRYAPNKN
ncbi:MAG: bifunctional DNA primase/polymerase [Solirubrobacteraceae bacterium]